MIATMEKEKQPSFRLFKNVLRCYRRLADNPKYPCIYYCFFVSHSKRVCVFTPELQMCCARACQHSCATTPLPASRYLDCLDLIDSHRPCACVWLTHFGIAQSDAATAQLMTELLALIDSKACRHACVLSPVHLQCPCALVATGTSRAHVAFSAAYVCVLCACLDQCRYNPTNTLMTLPSQPPCPSSAS